jgi:murein DD-endopeptidase MepM/ murein hydrolase activator NlpD
MNTMNQPRPPLGLLLSLPLLLLPACSPPTPDAAPARASAPSASRAATSAPTALPEPPGLQNKPIHSLRERTTSGATEWLVRNLVAGPIEVQCKLKQSRNVRTDPPLPRTLILPAGEERLIAEMLSVDAMLPSSAVVSCEAMLGDPRAHPASDVHYALPFMPGTKYTLDQGFNGRFTHHDDENRYALDFAVPEGTPVLAARAGIVMQVEEDFRAHGTDAAVYGDRANFVRILHEDGSMALYRHLSPASMLRKAGDRVQVGQLIGKSGNTGYSTGPHLHFAVQRNAGMALVTIPYTVEGVNTDAPND